jgi:hypothetical protein
MDISRENKDWYEAFAEGVHELFGKKWPDMLTEEEEQACLGYADERALRPERERDEEETLPDGKPRVIREVFDGSATLRFNISKGE